LSWLCGTRLVKKNTIDYDLSAIPKAMLSSLFFLSIFLLVLLMCKIRCVIIQSIVRDTLFTYICNIMLQWFPEVAHFCEGTPSILVGTKTDLRKDEQTRRMLGAQGTTPVTPEQGGAVAKEIGAKYMECSAKTGQGVREVFNAALKESLRGKWGKMVRRSKGCVTL
jgi:hypothetical protein